MRTGELNLPPADCGLARVVLMSSPGGVNKGEPIWLDGPGREWADQLGCPVGQDLSWSTPNLYHLLNVGTHERVSPAVPKLQDLHDTGQHQDMREESC